MKKTVRFAGLCLALCFAGCAYFNTFYNAKRYYSKAYRDVEKNQGRKTAGSVNKSAFQKSIEKSAKLIEYYPNSKYVDDALLLMGKSYYYQEEYQSALRKFEELLANYSGSELRFDAELGLAKTHVALKQFKEAEEILARLEGMNLTNDQKAEAYLYQGRLCEVKKEYDRAAQAFERVLGPGNKKLKVEAAFAMGDNCDSLHAYDRSVRAFREVLKHDPLPETRFEAEFRLAVALKNNGQYDEAVRLLERLLGDEKNKPREPDMRLQVGDCLARKGDINGAVTTYQDLAKAYPKTVHSARALYALGALYETRRRDYDRALDSFTQVKKEYTGRFLEGDSAEARGRDILRMRALRDVIDAAVGGGRGGEVEVDPTKAETEEDTVDAFGKIIYTFADTLIADSLVYVERIKNDPAFALQVQDLLDRQSRAGSSSVADTTGPAARAAWFKKREILDWNAVQDFEISDTDYEKSLVRARVENRRKRELLKLAENPELKSFKKEELDKNLFLLAELYLIRYQMPDSALAQYRMLVQRLPESPYALQSLYNMQYIHRNILRDTLTADSVARTLLELYPESPFARAIRRQFGMQAASAREDSVSVLFLEAERRLFNENNPAEAVRAYQFIYERFPDSELAAKAFYSTAWVYENALDSLRLAYVLYDSLMRKYPGTAFADRVKHKVDAVKEDAAKPKTTSQEAASQSAEVLKQPVYSSTTPPPQDAGVDSTAAGNPASPAAVPEAKAETGMPADSARSEPSIEGREAKKVD
jgi:TolA-binding protein